MPSMGWQHWDVWLRAPFMPGEFRHLDEIAYDCRVRYGSIVGTTNLRFNELRTYILTSPSGSSLVRNQHIELQKFDRAL
jgi:hypothetical protein